MSYYQARCTFVATLRTMSFRKPKSILSAELDMNMLATRIFCLNYMTIKRSITYKVRLTPQEAEIFQKKAMPYGNMSAMLRDAVAQFNDTATLGKIEALTAMMTLYRKYQNDLSWLGGNLNQITKRANELAISGELTQDYYDNTVFPELEKIQDLLQRIKDEQHNIAHKLIHR